MLVLFITYFKFGHKCHYLCRIVCPPGENLHKDMLYTFGKIRVSGFRKSTGCKVGQNILKTNHFAFLALKIAKNSKTYKIFMVIV